MNIIDLSHAIYNDMPVFPGDTPPKISIPANFVDHGYISRNICLSSHTGTHIDAPAHVIAKGATLDRYVIDMFMGSAVVIDLSRLNNFEIEVSHLKPFESDIRKSEFILLNTGWSHFWGQDSYFKDYPVLSVKAAIWLERFTLKGIGVDTISVDPYDSTDLQIHKILLEQFLIIENLTNLNSVPDQIFRFVCLPLKFKNADASPIRAVAILDKCL